jgi:hypothetical protein
MSIALLNREMINLYRLCFIPLRGYRTSPGGDQVRFVLLVESVKLLLNGLNLLVDVFQGVLDRILEEVQSLFYLHYLILQRLCLSDK